MKLNQSMINDIECKWLNRISTFRQSYAEFAASDSGAGGSGADDEEEGGQGLKEELLVSIARV